MAQRMVPESGQDGRSVLGMLAVQVERDPKTGATIVRSVAPVSTPAGVPKATTVFDDGRKSIHAIGGTVGQPSTEELGQILSAIDRVGMQVLLDEATVTPSKTETKAKTVEEKVPSFIIHPTMSEEDKGQLVSFRSDNLEAELRETCTASLGNADDKTMAVRDAAEKIDIVEDQMLEEGPVTLMFLGYTDATTGQDDAEGMITVERVIITEDGEEHVLGPETPAPLNSPVVKEARKESQDETFQDIPPGGNGAEVKVKVEEGDKGLNNSSPPNTAEGEGTSKHKTCQCCSVM